MISFVLSIKNMNINNNTQHGYSFFKVDKKY